MRPDGRLAPDARVIIAVAGLLAIPLVGTLLAVVLIAGLQGSAADLADRAVRSASAIDEAALQAKAIANDERGFLLTGRAEFVDQMDGRVARARTAFEVALEAAPGDREAALVLAARDGFERWLAVLDREIATATAGDRPMAVELSMGPNRAVRKAYEVSLGDARGLAAAAVATTAEAVSSASSRSTAILIVYVVVALALGAAIGSWMIRTVMRPAYALLHLLADPESGATRA